MRALALLSLALAVAPLHAQAKDPPAKGLVVHEWGIWRVHNDLELANADMRAIWEALPKFVYGQLPGRELPKHWQNLEIVDRPVLFFHTPAAVDLTLRLDFPRGLPGLWWPGTQSPALRDGRIVGRTAEGETFRSLEWQLRLKEPPPERRANAPGFEPVDARHWMAELRKVKADDVFARCGEMRFGVQRERFVYYDGLLPRGDWAALSFARGEVRIANKAKHPLFDVTLVDRRAAGKVRVARLEKLDGGADARALELKEIDAAEWAREGPKTLLGQLQGAGLFEDEAAALVELSRAELFEADGLTLFYRLPQDEYERLLPLTLKPTAEKLVRVGLVIHPACDPELAGRVEELVRQLGADEYAARQQAQERLEKMGRAAFPHLLRLRKKNFEAEVQKRLDELLAKWESAPGARKE
jgi:hypothetical protein